MKKPYRIKHLIESQNDHGRIVAALANELEMMRYIVRNDRHRDLYILNSSEHILFLFEVKTDLDTTSIYTSIGQLLYHSFSQQTLPKRILVIPGQPTFNTQKVLKRIGINIITYRMLERKIEFLNLKNSLEN